MNFTASDIERIVREVLAQLEGADPAESACATSMEAAPSESTTVESGAIDSTELVLTTPVVTVDQIERKLDGIRQIVVSPGTVLTPSAREVLQDKKVAVRYTTTTLKPVSVAGPRVTLVAALTPVEVISIAEPLTRSGIAVEASTSRCLVETSDRMAQVLTDQSARGVILTAYRSAALCLLNRKPGVRAVSVDGIESIEQEVREVGANLMVVDPIGKSQFHLKRMVEAFARLDGIECPSALTERLT